MRTAKTRLPFVLKVASEVNGEQFTITGRGVVDPIGVYTARLRFSRLPRNFHPILVTSYTVSICCIAEAAQRNGGLNFRSLLGRSALYEAIRQIVVGDGIGLEIGGTVEEKAGVIRFAGTLRGRSRVPADILPMAFYRERLTSDAAGAVVGKGEGSLFRARGKDLRVGMRTSYVFKKKAVMPFEQVRTVTDSGSLDGLDYRVVLHSIVERAAGKPRSASRRPKR
jgi:hypothetical protein